MGTQRQWTAVEVVGVVCAAVVVLSIATANILGELSEPLWLLLVPVGMLGFGLAALVSLVLAARRRRVR